MKYKISQHAVLGQLWKRTGFPPMKGFIDNELTVVTGYWTIDILRLDEWLHKHYGHYEDNGLSMMAIIKSKHGDFAAQLIDELL